MLPHTIKPVLCCAQTHVHCCAFLHFIVCSNSEYRSFIIYSSIGNKFARWSNIIWRRYVGIGADFQIFGIPLCGNSTLHFLLFFCCSSYIVCAQNSFIELQYAFGVTKKVEQALRNGILTVVHNVPVRGSLKRTLQAPEEYLNMQFDNADWGICQEWNTETVVATLILSSSLTRGTAKVEASQRCVQIQGGFPTDCWPCNKKNCSTKACGPTRLHQPTSGTAAWMFKSSLEVESYE